jgi:hypothetical protein
MGVGIMGFLKVVIFMVEFGTMVNSVEFGGNLNTTWETKLYLNFYI